MKFDSYKVWMHLQTFYQKCKLFKKMIIVLHKSYLL